MTLPSTTDVVIAGAGMAGLVAAVELTRRGLQVVLLERSDAAGGRVRTDLVDGFRLDRGFQLLNAAYPQFGRLQRAGVLDLDRLQLQEFDAGVRVALESGHAVLADPLRSPGDLWASVRAPLGTPLEKARFAAWALRRGLDRPARLLAERDEPYAAAFDRAGVTGRLRTGVLDPFLAGVLGEDTGVTSTRFVSMVIRSFVRGTPAVPAWGMQALPDQLAAALPAGTLRTGVTVESVTDDGVLTDAGPVAARAVLVATGPQAASRLIGLPAPAVRSLTTVWFVADEAPCPRPILHVDGLRRGPIVNAAVLSAAAPAYSPDGRALIAASAVGTGVSEADVRRHAGVIYGVDPTGWDTIRVDRIAEALPAMVAPLDIRQPVRVGERRWVAGDHRDTASLQGALASGHRAARSILAQL